MEVAADLFHTIVYTKKLLYYATSASVYWKTQRSEV